MHGLRVYSSITFLHCPALEDFWQQRRNKIWNVQSQELDSGKYIEISRFVDEEHSMEVLPDWMRNRKIYLTYQSWAVKLNKITNYVNRIKHILIIWAKAKNILSLENITKFMSCDEVFKAHTDDNMRERNHRGGQEDS